MKKKTYQQPKMKVVELDHADIICTSTQAAFSLSENEEDVKYTVEIWETNVSN